MSLHIPPYTPPEHSRHPEERLLDALLARLCELVPSTYSVDDAINLRFLIASLPEVAILIDNYLRELGPRIDKQGCLFARAQVPMHYQPFHGLLPVFISRTARQASGHCGECRQPLAREFLFYSEEKHRHWHYRFCHACLAGLTTQLYVEHFNDEVQGNRQPPRPATVPGTILAVAGSGPGNCLTLDDYSTRQPWDIYMTGEDVITIANFIDVPAWYAAKFEQDDIDAGLLLGGHYLLSHHIGEPESFYPRASQIGGFPRDEVPHDKYAEPYQPPANEGHEFVARFSMELLVANTYSPMALLSLYEEAGKPGALRGYVTIHGH